MNGIVVLNKPAGISSNTACRKVGKILGEKKVGHLGTLDPMAEGVLPVSLGKCTKLFDYYLNKNKTYIAEFTFGIETDTLDAEGIIISSGGQIPTLEEINTVLNKMIGEQYQLPPKYSAKKVNGKRAYDLARANVDFNLEPKLIHIYDLQCLSKVNHNTFQFKIECSSGTYIRSIARDIASKLNTHAYMSKLTRIKCGEFLIENSFKFEEINEKSIINLNTIFKNTKQIVIDNEKLLSTFINSSRLKLDNCNSTIEDCVLVYKNKIISKGVLDNGYFISKIRFI